MRKKYILLIILLISLLIFFYNLDIVRFTAKKYLSLQTKTLIKEYILGKEKVEQLKKERELNKMNYNQKVLPETQFTNMYLKEVSLNDLRLLSVKFFMEQFRDYLIIIGDKGKIFFINKQFIVDPEDLNWTQVSTNLNLNNIKIKDALVLEDKIYISYLEFDVETKKCNTMNISKAKISEKQLNFEIFFTSNECQGFNAGRMVFYKHDNKDGLLFTTTAECHFNNLAQDDNSLSGKILFIDFETSNYIIFSKGHRNPQGLTIEKNLILSAEHGPIGGDEINLIKFGQNYGWPISSYGETDTCLKRSSKVYDYLKNHSEHGFIEPIYSFVSSIGINQIIKVPDNFSEYWQNNFLVTSLAGGTIYRILFDKNFSKVIYNEKIFIGKRMRDIVYSDEYNVFLIALEGGYSHTRNIDIAPSIGILSSSFEQ